MVDYTYLSKQNIKDIQKVLHAKTITYRNENNLEPNTATFNFCENTKCTITLNENGLVSIELIIDEKIDLNNNIKSFEDVHPSCSKFITDFELFLKTNNLSYPYSIWKYPVLFTDESPPYTITTIFPLLNFEQDTESINIKICGNDISIDIPKNIVKNKEINEYITTDWFNTLTNKDKIELFNLHELKEVDYSILND